MRIALLFLSFILLSQATWAASQRPGKDVHFSQQKIAEFVRKVQNTLAKKGARVAIIARVGGIDEDLADGVQYTHTGIAVYGEIKTKDHRLVPGYAIFNLYQTNALIQSELVQNYPLDFFATATSLKAGIIIPTEELQKRLLKLIRSGHYKDLHNPKFSAISNPFDTTFQNSSEMTLNSITAAIYETTDYKIIKSNIKAYFIPHSLVINPFKLMAGAFFSKEIETSDHSSDIQIATFSSIANFLKTYKASAEILEITP